MENKIVISKIRIATTPTGNPFVVMMKRKAGRISPNLPHPIIHPILNELTLLYTILSEGGGRNQCNWRVTERGDTSADCSADCK